MKNIIKIWLISAAALIVLGGIIFVIVMSAFGWDFTKISTVKYVTNEHEITSEFSDISIETATADVIFAPSTDGKCRIVCVEH